MSNIRIEGIVEEVRVEEFEADYTAEKLRRGN